MSRSLSRGAAIQNVVAVSGAAALQLASSLELRDRLPDALAESARRLVVRKVGKLRLDGLREVRVFDDGIHRLFAQKVGVELHTQHTHHKSAQIKSEEGWRRGGARTLLVSAADSTLGLNGGWIFFCMSFLKSMCLAKNGCDLIDSAPVTPSRC